MTIFPFRFGIDELDSLITGESRDDDLLLNEDGPWSAAIVGPDGCGKSVLALHLCSEYRSASAQCVNSKGVAVLYVSTDLSASQASRQWHSFGLCLPKTRKNAISRAYWRLPVHYSERPLPVVELDSGLVQLASKSLEEPSALEEYLLSLTENGANHADVAFIDLQRDTAGDDWHFVNQLIGMLPKRGKGDSPKHLVIIDAVEGLEAFVGRTDSFGQKRTRRSRVAQILRMANRVGAHVVFVVEEPKKFAKLPEQFVTDLVIRLHVQEERDYQQRAIEIEKCRSSAHGRGLHELSIRSGKGTFTGSVCHADDPTIPWNFVTEHKEIERRVHRSISDAVSLLLACKPDSQANWISFFYAELQSDKAAVVQSTQHRYQPLATENICDLVEIVSDAYAKKIVRASELRKLLSALRLNAEISYIYDNDGFTLKSGNEVDQVLNLNRAFCKTFPSLSMDPLLMNRDICGKETILKHAFERFCEHYFESSLIAFMDCMMEHLLGPFPRFLEKGDPIQQTLFRSAFGKNLDSVPRGLAHIHVTPSVHRILKGIRLEPKKIEESNGHATFGSQLGQLEELLNPGPHESPNEQKS